MVKGAGVIAYTQEGYILIAYQNVGTWSFPKGHRNGKEPWKYTAAREFQEETNQPREKIKEIEAKLSEEMKTNTDGAAYLYFYEITPAEVELIYPDGVEIYSLMWIHIDKLDEFRQENPVNKTISKLNILNFKLKTGLPLTEKEKKIEKKLLNSYDEEKIVEKKSLNPYANSFVPSFSFRKSRKSVRKSRKSVRKSRKSVRKSRKVKKNNKNSE